MAKVLSRVDGSGYLLICPGCEYGHFYDSRWSFNGNLDKPTFSPSFLSKYERPGDFKEEVCHSFVTDGVIQFLPDCTHKLAGLSVELEDIDVEVKS